jgi:GTP-binding protein
MSFTIAIVGRPNVGKSTLFNRLVGRRVALVDDRPGVTRDRREGEARLGDLDFTVIDTAGLEESTPDSLSGRMRAQTETAIAQADAIFFMIDARSGPIPDDRYFAELVRKSGKPTVLIANKMEGEAGQAGRFDAYALGLGDPVALSAEHNEGLPDLYDALHPTWTCTMALCDRPPASKTSERQRPGLLYTERMRALMQETCFSAQAVPKKARQRLHQRSKR